LKYPKAYVSFLVHFHGDRDYFECHEILEEYWKEVAPRNRDSHWVGFIQVAVALYHDRRGNEQGAIRTISKAQINLSNKSRELTQLGLDIDELLVLLNHTRERMIARKPYESINLPLIDELLVKQCIAECKKLGLTWCSDHHFDNRSLIDKHLVRDRTKVILERKRQIEKRKRPISPYNYLRD
jgi:predicted metal-dependent hydrolase